MMSWILDLKSEARHLDFALFQLFAGLSGVRVGERASIHKRDLISSQVENLASKYKQAIKTSEYIPPT
jgi:hypothetical protein